ncbi:hypothetical protein WEN_02945 [Mycoplasma wenyonii str. Massachusetts]|uniref:Uncharacterized protein n=1 Tax=Mycoplasma wenyonii (strain Massachusetts) TaxID=1197325 RepID=I6ZFI3_MYCWM|nr:hypothetical protein [Mycoplasma wenyonii]AFN65372.1 hypothetical protein WEN_02945 [Mycoplasma wenyonii str. Massachusetts]
MAVSPAIRIFQIFVGLGSVSTVSLIPSFFRKIEEIKLPRGDRQVAEDYREEQKEEKQDNSKSAMQEAVQRMGDGKAEKRCFWWFTNKNLFEIFMCIDMQTLKSPSLFHFNWREKGASLKDKLHEITEITYNGTSILKMTLDNRWTKDVPSYLKVLFAWYRRGDKNFIPKNHCSITQSENSRNYQLTCQVGDKKYTETVSPELPNET